MSGGWNTKAQQLFEDIAAQGDKVGFNIIKHLALLVFHELKYLETYYAWAIGKTIAQNHANLIAIIKPIQTSEYGSNCGIIAMSQ